MASAASQSSGNLLLSVLGPGGSNNLSISPGQEIELTIRMTVTSLPAGFPFLAWNGGDFQINSGSDATFQQTTYLLSGAGGWTSVPPQGGTSRYFTGGPASTQFFFTPGATLDLGRIVLRVGNAPDCFEVTLDQVSMLDSDFLPIPTQTSGFFYGNLNCIPEPSSAVLLGLAIIGLSFQRRVCKQPIVGHSKQLAVTIPTVRPRLQN